MPLDSTASGASKETQEETPSGNREQPSLQQRMGSPGERDLGVREGLPGASSRES